MMHIAEEGMIKGRKTEWEAATAFHAWDEGKTKQGYWEWGGPERMVHKEIQGDRIDRVEW